MQDENGAKPDSLLTRVKAYVADNLSLFSFSYRVAKQLVFPANQVYKVGIFSIERSECTHNLYSTAYVELGVTRLIERVVQEMTLLHELIETNGIKLSVGVYP